METEPRSNTQHSLVEERRSGAVRLDVAVSIMQRSHHRENKSAHLPEEITMVDAVSYHKGRDTL